MKRILCILVLLSGVIHAQEETSEKKSWYRPHSIAISQRLGGVDNYQTGVDIVNIGLGAIGDGLDFGTLSALTAQNHYGAFSTQIEFYTQRRKGRSQYTPMIGLRITYAGDTPNALGGFHYGVLLGGSQYIFDFRSKETGLGWSMMANGGVTLDIGSFSDTTDVEYDGMKLSLPNNYPIIFGAEVDFKVIYNFHKEIGATAGFNMGYQHSYGVKAFDVTTVGPGIPALMLVLDHSFVWALNIGIIF